MTRRRLPVGPIAVLLVVIVLAVAGARPLPPDDVYLDTDNPRPSGSRGVVDTARALGAQVTVGVDVAPDDDVVVLLPPGFGDPLDDSQRQPLEDWVRGGGRLVVAEPETELPPAIELFQFDEGDADGPLPPGDCPVAALNAVGPITPPVDGSWYLLAPVEGAAACYTLFEHALVAARPLGNGVVVAIADQDVFTNEYLPQTAELVMALLVTRPGVKVKVLLAADIGPQDETLGDLIPGGLKRAFGQVLVALFVFALYRGRRLGRPVVEPQPVVIESGELVHAVARLHHRAGHGYQSAAQLRADLVRRTAIVLGLTADASPDAVLAQVVGRALVPESTARQAFTDPLPADDEGLVRLAQAVDDVDQEVFRVK